MNLREEHLIRSDMQDAETWSLREAANERKKRKETEKSKRERERVCSEP